MIRLLILNLILLSSSFSSFAQNKSISLRIEKMAPNETLESIAKVLKQRLEERYNRSFQVTPDNTTISVSSDTLDSSMIYGLLDNGSLQVWQTYNATELSDNLKDGDKYLSEKTGIKFALFSMLVPAIVKNDSGYLHFKESPCIGYVSFKDTQQVRKYFDWLIEDRILPADLKIGWTLETIYENKYVSLIAIKTRNPLTLSKFGKLKVSPYNDKYELLIDLSSNDILKWENFTNDNINKSIAMTFCDKVYSYPKVLKKISLGSLLIWQKEKENLINLDIDLRYPLYSKIIL